MAISRSNARRATSRRTLAPLLLSLALGVLLLLGAAPAFAQSKIAVIDTQRAVMETEDGLRVAAMLKKLFDTRQLELDGKQRALQDDRDALEKEAAAGKASKESLQKKYENLQKQMADLQAQLVDAQREMQRKEKELTTPILNGVLGAVRRIAAQEGFDMVVEKSVVPYFRADLELTDRAIQMYNGGVGGGVAPVAPAAPAAPAKAPAPKK